MQPYFFPYIGYFQLISSVDAFVIYDNIKYTKKGWINRNRILHNNQPALLSLPIKSASDSLDVRDRYLAETFIRRKMLNQIEQAYKKAPHFQSVFPVISNAINATQNNLFDYVFNSVREVCTYLEIETKIIVSSKIDADLSKTGENKVLEYCNKLGATTYINAIGGQALYSKETFRTNDIDLKFIQTKHLSYPQFGAEFVPWLSIIDVMMFNEKSAIKTFLTTGYELI